MVLQQLRRLVTSVWFDLIVVATFILIVVGQSTFNKTFWYCPKTSPVVGIYIGGTASDNWIGSGFLVSNKHVITAAHVLAEFPHQLKFSDNILFQLKRSAKDQKPLNIGDEVNIHLNGFAYSVVIKGKVAYKNEQYDIGVVELQEPITLTEITPLKISAEQPNVGEQLTYLGCIEEQPVIIPLTVINPHFIMKWSSWGAEETSQPMILCAYALVGGTSGGAVVNSKGYVIAVHVGRYGNISIETPLWKVYNKLMEVLK